MDTGGRSSDAPSIEMGSIFRSPWSFLPLRPSGSSMMVETSQLGTAVPARRSMLSPAGPRGENGEKNTAGCPS